MHWQTLLSELGAAPKALPSMQRLCTIFRMHDTTFFTSSWCTFEIICPKFSINSGYILMMKKVCKSLLSSQIWCGGDQSLGLVQFLSSFFSRPDFWFKQVQRQPGPLLHYCNVVKMGILSKSITLKGIPFSYHNWLIQWSRMRQKNAFHHEFLFLLFSSAAKRSKKSLPSALLSCPALLRQLFLWKMHLELVLLALIAVLEILPEMLCCKNFLHSIFSK